MTVALITDHIEQAVARLATQYQGAPTVVGMFSALVGRVQVLEDVLEDLNTQRLLTGGKARGAQLDAIGTVVGLKRGNLDDATYYVLLLGTVAKNYSDGTVPTLLALAQAIWQASAAYITTPDAPGHARRAAYAQLSLAVADPQTPDSLTNLLVGIVQAALGGGITLVSVCKYASAGAFACQGPQPWVAGCSDIDGQGGGALATLLYANPLA